MGGRVSAVASIMIVFYNEQDGQWNLYGFQPQFLTGRDMTKNFGKTKCRLSIFFFQSS